MIPRRSQLTLVFSALFTLSVILAPFISAQNNSSGSSQSAGGLRIVTLPTSKGDVKVSLPDDIRAATRSQERLSLNRRERTRKKKRKT